MKVNLKLLGKNLHRLRVAAQMSQEELASAAGISRNMYIRYESGLSCPPLDKLLQIAELLDTTIDLLLTDCTVHTRYIAADQGFSLLVRKYLGLSYVSKKVIMHEIKLLRELEDGVYR